jgi:hypothetical protein
MIEGVSTTEVLSARVTTLKIDLSGPILIPSYRLFKGQQLKIDDATLAVVDESRLVEKGST